MRAHPQVGDPVRGFPPGRRGVLLPEADRGAAAAGIALYTASKPLVVAAQRVAHLAVRLAGARVLPGTTVAFDPGTTRDQWQHLLEAWQQVTGPVDALAVYRRRQAARDGLTLVVTRGGRGVAVVKVRDRADGLTREQQVLARIGRPLTFDVPRPLGQGQVDDLHWSAQTCVFTRPHAAVMTPPAGLFAEVRDVTTDALHGISGSTVSGSTVSGSTVSGSTVSGSTVSGSTVSGSTVSGSTVSGSTVSGSTPGQVGAHRDLTPWNLRRDHRGRLWLFDWEDADLAPEQTDRAYFWAASQLVTRRPMPTDLPVTAITAAREIFAARVAGNPEDSAASRAVFAAFSEAETP